MYDTFVSMHSQAQPPRESDTPTPATWAVLRPSLDLALIGNGTIAALVDAAGSIVWCCLPRFDGEPVFGALMRGADPTEGLFTIVIENQQRSEQAYDAATAVLRTRLFDSEGQAIEITDFAPRFVHHGRMFRPAQLVRRLRVLHGRPRVSIRLLPLTGLDALTPQVTRGSNHLRYLLSGQVLRLTTNAPVSFVASGRWFTLHSPLSLVLGPDETLDGDIEETARQFEERTAAEWRQWTSRLALPFDWQDAVIRAAITLKLCQYEETGAIVAALTTSIPEAPDSGRNWDYRYCWLRDAFFVVRALNSLAEVGTMESYLRWLYDVLRDGRGRVLQPLYGVGLEHDLSERVLDGWTGYRGMGPMRVGNQAFEHAQHDVYGHVVLGASQAFFDHRLQRRADLQDFALLETVGAQAWRLHDQPDAGMWELRTRAHVHTASAVMCWAACDRLAKIGSALGQPERSARWTVRAEAIRQRVLVACWNERRQAFVDSFDGEMLDAGVLLMAEVGFIDARDPRFLSTLDALERTLCDGPHMRRYEAADDFGTPQTAFNVCSFWRIDALARVGRLAQAREAFDALLAARNAAGMLSEDFDPRSAELWGNLPQTYSMVGIVNGAVRLSRRWEEFV